MILAIDTSEIQRLYIYAQHTILIACGEYKPYECVMIGDDLYLDIECAQNIGMNTILVSTKNENTAGVNTIVVKKVEEIDIPLIESIK